MARMIPDSFDYSCTESKGEERVYNALKKHLDDKWLICHSWRWVKHYLNQRGRKNQGEGDFILFHPDYGIIVIEVKGGTIEFRNDGKYYSNSKLIQNPEKQSSDTKFDLIERLKEKKLNYSCRVNHCVWFPDIDWNLSYPPNLNSTLLLDKNTLVDPEVYIIKVAGYTQPITDPQIIQSIEKLLFTPFKVVKNYLFRIDDTIEEQVRLTKLQESIYEGLGLNSILGVRGRAGTGKTLLATYKAVELSGFGKRVLYLCSGKGLSEFLEEKLSPMGIEVFTFQKYALLYLQKYYPMRVPVDFKGDSDFEYILGAFSEVAEENLDEYDACFIDEAQDMKIEIFDGLRKAFSLHGYFYYFYDPMQIAYSRTVKVKDKFSEYRNFIYTLYRNMRNTIEVSRASLNILRHEYNPERDFSSIPGEPPEVVLVDENLHNEVKKKIIELTIIQKVPIPYISILSMRGEGKSVVGEVIENIQVNTFRKFKGLDNNVILIVDVTYQHFVDEVYARELYMAITRSRYSVVLFMENNSSPMKTEFCKKYNIITPNTEFITHILKENNYE